MASHLLKYAVLSTSLQHPMSELEVIEAVTSSYLPWVQKLFVTSNIKTIEDNSVLNELEVIEGQHHYPQQWSNQNRPHAPSSYSREDYRDGRTHAVRQTYVSREQRLSRNSRYPEQEGYDIQETYRPGHKRRNYSPRRNMTNASTLNAEVTPYNQARNSQENEMDNRTGNFRGTEQGTTCCSHPRENRFTVNKSDINNSVNSVDSDVSNSASGSNLKTGKY